MGSDSSGFYFTLHLSLQAIKFARVVELVDTLDLGSSASRRGGSSPFTRTKKTLTFVRVFLFYIG